MKHRFFNNILLVLAPLHLTVFSQGLFVDKSERVLGFSGAYGFGNGMTAFGASFGINPLPYVDFGLGYAKSTSQEPEIGVKSLAIGGAIYFLQQGKTVPFGLYGTATYLRANVSDEDENDYGESSVAFGGGLYKRFLCCVQVEIMPQFEFSYNVTFYSSVWTGGFSFVSPINNHLLLVIGPWYAWYPDEKNTRTVGIDITLVFNISKKMAVPDPEKLN